jgi:hypothetical protein
VNLCLLCDATTDFRVELLMGQPLRGQLNSSTAILEITSEYTDVKTFDKAAHVRMQQFVIWG